MKARALLLLALLATALVSPAAIPGADLLVNLISKEFDANGDDKIDAGEWQAGCLSGFDQMDGNQDGSISVAEIEALKGPIAEEMGDFGAAVAVALIKRILMSLDKNGDMLISKKEYADGCEAFFKKLDANGDGQISKAELAELPTKLLQ
jgi:Ca2+-binding EF-hand superfamily protein